MDYFGVPFRMEYVRRIADARKDYGLIDNEEMGFVMLQSLSDHTKLPALHGRKPRTAIASQI